MPNKTEKYLLRLLTAMGQMKHITEPGVLIMPTQIRSQLIADGWDLLEKLQTENHEKV